MGICTQLLVSVKNKENFEKSFSDEQEIVSTQKENAS